MSPEERAFLKRADRLSVAFRRRYGLADEDAWTDEQLERALADHGYPPLDALPDTSQGPLLRTPDTDAPGRPWQRVNAAHLLGHAILGHEGGRCRGCEDWGPDAHERAVRALMARGRGRDEAEAELLREAPSAARPLDPCVPE